MIHAVRVGALLLSIVHYPHHAEKSLASVSSRDGLAVSSVWAVRLGHKCTPVRADSNLA